MKKMLSVLNLILITFLFTAIPCLAEVKEPAAKMPHGPSTQEKIQIPSAKSLGNGRFSIGQIIVDTTKKEATVPGSLKMNEGVIEYIASIKGGFKLYETIFELETNAYEFNLAMILIGLDQKKGKAPAHHFDPKAPEGDPVEIWVEWVEESKKKVHRAEDFVLDESSKKTMPYTNWVYTGSTVFEDGTYMAQMDGVLVSFVHDPSSIIESPTDFGVTQYGMLVVNKKIAPPIGTKVQLKIKSLKKD